MSQLITLEMYRGPKPLEQPFEYNATDLLTKVNSLLQELSVTSIVITSGYRTQALNKAIGGATNSKHCTAQAVDLADNERIIGNKLMLNPNLLKLRGMACEDLRYCVRQNGNKWIHLQSVMPKSGNTFFIPYPNGPKIV